MFNRSINVIVIFLPFGFALLIVNIRLAGVIILVDSCLIMFLQASYVAVLSSGATANVPPINPFSFIQAALNGGVDGLLVGFAIVAGGEGSGLSLHTVAILGLCRHVIINNAKGVTPWCAVAKCLSISVSLQMG